MMLSTHEIVCPDQLSARDADPSRTAVVGARSDLALESARLATVAGMVEPVLIRAPNGTRTRAEAMGWDLGALEIVPSARKTDVAGLAARLGAEGRVGR